MYTIPDLNKFSPRSDDVAASIVTDSASLKNGIWPRSLPLMMAAFYMALFIIRPWEELFPSLSVIYPEKLYAICMILAVIVSDRKPFQLTLQSKSVILFFIAMIFSSLFAYNPSLSWDVLYENLSLIIYYFIILLVIRNSYDLVFIVLSYITIMLVYLGKSQWEFFINGRHRYTMGVVRMVGIESSFGGPNSVAMSIVISLPFAVFLWKYRATISNTWPVVWQTRLRRGLILYGILALSSIILTNSRSGFIGFILYVAILMFSGKGIGKKIGYIFIGVCILSLGWIIVPEENKGRIRTIWAPEEGPANAQESAEGRIAGYNAGVVMFKSRPFTGVGIGNFSAYRVPNIDGIPLQAHNLEGQLLGEMGSLGVCAFLLMIGATLVNCRITARLSKFQNDIKMMLLGDLARACMVSLILLVFLGTFAHNLFRYNWLWLAAFSVLALQFQKDMLKRKEVVDVYN